MNLYADVRALAAAIGIRLPPTEIGDVETGIVVRTATARLTEALRRDWAVRVLDAWLDADSVRESALGGGYGGPAELRCCHLSGVPHYGNSLEAARLAAAEAVWPELPESVRAELGERP